MKRRRMEQNDFVFQKTELKDKAEEFKRLCETIDTEKDLEDAKRFLRYEIERKIQDFDYEDNLTQQVRNWVEVSDGHFAVRDLYYALNAKETREKNVVRQAVFNLVREGVIKKYGDKHSVYKRVERDIAKMDWKNASIEEVPVIYPLNLESQFATYRKNIMIISGTPDSGKSAFLIDFIKKNMKQAKEIFGHPIYYFNSEMSPEELKIRLIKHEDINEEDWDFEPYMRASAFDEVIVPDACNVIDYLELDEAYTVRRKLRHIHDQLTTGICLVGLQKPYGRDMGYGKEFGLQLPRLYLSMENGRAKILKAKNRKTENSPTGKVRDFKLVQGWKIIPTDGCWHYPEDDPYERKRRKWRE